MTVTFFLLVKYMGSMIVVTFTGAHKKKRSFFTHASVGFTHFSKFSYMRTSELQPIPYVKYMDSGIV
jgi:hypothetical protein